MKTEHFHYALSIAFTIFLTPLSAHIDVTPEETRIIGEWVWENECAGSVLGLTSWNKNEEFASMGIAHFIWHPSKANSSFAESFPQLLKFLESKEATIPQWLKKDSTCPWSDRESFLADIHSPRMKELRQLLSDTVELQCLFLIQRLENVLPLLCKKLSNRQAKHVRKQFERVASTPEGVAVLVDYLNFKGEGLGSLSNYKGKGWGLLQVLQSMRGSKKGPKAINQFARRAKAMLRRRVHHAPRNRHEEQWLAAWEKRIDRYTM
ncbi:MAG: hypothetical protein CMO81_11330 [Waddliaceae bacterium]|nr:hypothetical protein [Waddliaceae bacterium]